MFYSVSSLDARLRTPVALARRLRRLTFTPVDLPPALFDVDVRRGLPPCCTIPWRALEPPLNALTADAARLHLRLTCLDLPTRRRASASTRRFASSRDALTSTDTAGTEMLVYGALASLSSSRDSACLVSPRPLSRNALLAWWAMEAAIERRRPLRPRATFPLLFGNPRIGALIWDENAKSSRRVRISYCSICVLCEDRSGEM